MCVNTLETEIWTLVEPEDVCIDADIDEEQPFDVASVDECSRKCFGIASHFAYGTNDFELQGCKNGFCKCHCIKKCQLLKREKYLFFRYKPEANRVIDGKLII